MLFGPGHSHRLILNLPVVEIAVVEMVTKGGDHPNKSGCQNKKASLD